ncbi:MAG: phospholipase D family protein [Deltaproteobacteria bacterium]|nr:phospholipase D family protein [Candidatus Tharpella sp.]
MYLPANPFLREHRYTNRVLSILPLLLIMLITGCATLPTDYTRTESTAIDDYQSTSMGQHFATAEAEHEGESGFAIIRYGRNAYNMRIAMSDLAEKTIDLQVYIWETDETGRILAERLVRAADRGVRVRLLVDDMGVGASDQSIAALDAHPNIEIRIFNPFANRKTQIFDFITDLGRVNHRMHNKIMVIDNSLAIVGGRNIGDHYFSVNPDTNFRDLDIAAVGPVVRDISGVFDHFWSGSWAVPIAALVNCPYTDADLQVVVARLRKKIAAGEYPYAIDDDVATLRANIAATGDVLTWAPGWVVWDDPASIRETGKAGDMVAALRRKLGTVREALIIESAYFVVGDNSVARVKELVDNGVRVRVLTNSLASNDVLAAHAGHANYRKELLEVGAEVYEFRVDSSVIKKTWKGESKAGLHTKALVFDNETLFIGSFNLDPRSANINTEAGLYVESLELAAQVLAYMDEGVLPENSYRLMLDENDNLVWITEDDGVEVRYDKDPLSTFGQRFLSGFIGILPIESQL